MFLCPCCASVVLSVICSNYDRRTERGENGTWYVNVVTLGLTERGKALSILAEKTSSSTAALHAVLLEIHTTDGEES